MVLARDLNSRMDRTNANLGCISLGYPIDTTRCLVPVKLLKKLKQIQGQYRLFSMLIGGG